MASNLNAAVYLENQKDIGIALATDEDKGKTFGFLTPTTTKWGDSKIDSAGKMYCITFAADSTQCIFGAGTRVEVWAR